MRLLLIFVYALFVTMKDRNFYRNNKASCLKFCTFTEIYTTSKRTIGYYLGITTDRNYQLLELPIRLVGIPNWLEILIRIAKNYQHSELPTFKITNLWNFQQKHRMRTWVWAKVWVRIWFREWIRVWFRVWIRV